jgi:hypothetical protein
MDSANQPCLRLTTSSLLPAHLSYLFQYAVGKDKFRRGLLTALVHLLTSQRAVERTAGHTHAGSRARSLSRRRRQSIYADRPRPIVLAPVPTAQ